MYIDIYVYIHIYTMVTMVLLLFITSHILLHRPGMLEQPGSEKSSRPT